MRHSWLTQAGGVSSNQPVFVNGNYPMKTNFTWQGLLDLFATKTCGVFHRDTGEVADGGLYLSSRYLRAAHLLTRVFL